MHITEKLFFIPYVFAIGEGESDGGADGDGGGGDTSKTYTQEDLQRAIDEATAGARQKNAQLLDELKPLKQAVSRLGDTDVDEILKFKQQLQENEYLRLISEGKHDEAYEKRFEKDRLQYQTEIESTRTQLETLQQERDAATSRLEDVLISETVRGEFLAQKGYDSGAMDAVMRARQIFKLEDGAPVARNEKGELIAGEKGPLTIPEYVAILKKDAPHLFPGSAGSGVEGGQGGDGGPSLEQQRIAAAKRGDHATVKKLREKAMQSKGGLI